MAPDPSRAPVQGLYALIDASVHGGRAELATACGVAQDAGAQWIQLRCKEADDHKFHAFVSSCVRALTNPETILWINDRVDLAALFPVRGVHLGQEDLPPKIARELLPPQVLIGRSCHDLTQVGIAHADPAVDVVAVGPLFETRSKANPEPSVGLTGLDTARRATDKTLVAIGGISFSNYLEVRRRGADLVAMIGALGSGAELGPRCQQLAALEREL